MKKCSAKETLFCVMYAESRNGREAAARAGYSMPQRAAVKLLEKAYIKKEIAKISEAKTVDMSEVCAGYRRLAFGSTADALKLLFTADSPGDEALERFDMFNVSEIKRKKSEKESTLEIKFFDRLKALQHLESAGGALSPGDNALPFYEALEKSAEKITKGQ
ncbi:MAG: terminase small subunit [Oscillospiraceae bacterium]|nr:terminase small subunit [Oscillospiraceae bacterium]